MYYIIIIIFIIRTNGVRLDFPQIDILYRQVNFRYVCDFIRLRLFLIST